MDLDSFLKNHLFSLRNSSIFSLRDLPSILIPVRTIYLKFNFPAERTNAGGGRIFQEEAKSDEITKVSNIRDGEIINRDDVDFVLNNIAKSNIIIYRKLGGMIKRLKTPHFKSYGDFKNEIK